MLANCDVIVIFPTYGQFEAIRKPTSESMVFKTYIFIDSNLLSYKNWKQNQNISNTTLILLLWVKVLFLQKNTDFLKYWTNTDISKIKGVLLLKIIFSETTCVCMFLLTKFKVSSIVLTTFRQR